MDLVKLDILRLMMSTETDLQTIFEYFLDHFGENEEFISLGKPLTDQHHPLLSVIHTVAQEIFAKYKMKANPLRLEHLLLIHVPDHKLIHGGMLLQGHMANVLYFEDLKVGLMVVVMKQNEFARFSLAKAPQEIRYNN